MPTFNARCVVVGVDGSESGRSAAAWAAAEAERRALDLRMVNVYAPPIELYPVPGAMTAQLSHAARAWATTMLFQIGRELGQLHPDLKIHTAVRHGHPVSVLEEESEHAVLTVVGAHGAYQFSDALVGSVAARIARRSHSPLVVIRTPPADSAATGTGPIIVGVDDSPLAQAAIGFAFDEAALRGTELIAVHSWDVEPLIRTMAAIPMPLQLEAVADDELRLLTQQLAGWADQFPDIRVQHTVATGHPVSALIDKAASADAQLIVVGSRGRGGFAGLLLGSTSAALIAHAGCPVAIIRDHRALHS